MGLVISCFVLGFYLTTDVLSSDDVFKCCLLTVLEAFALGSSVHSVCVDLPLDIFSASFPQQLRQASSSRDLIIVFYPKSALGLTPASCPPLPPLSEKREKEWKRWVRLLPTAILGSMESTPRPPLHARGHPPAAHSVALSLSSCWPNQRYPLSSVTRAAALQRLSTLFHTSFIQFHHIIALW